MVLEIIEIKWVAVAVCGSECWILEQPSNLPVATMSTITTYLPVYLLTYVLTYLLTYLLTYFTYSLTYLLAYLRGLEGVGLLTN